MYKISTLIKQPEFGFLVSFKIVFDKGVSNIDDVKETYMGIVNDASVKLKKKQKLALEDLDQIETECKILHMSKN